MKQSGSNRLLAIALGSLSLLGAGLARGEDSVPGSDWEGYNKTPQGQRYSPLDEINASNAASLVEVCRAPLADKGSLQAGPIVIEDSLYLTTPTDTWSIDPVNCRIKWRTPYHRSEQPGLVIPIISERRRSTEHMPWIDAAPIGGQIDRLCAPEHAADARFADRRRDHSRALALLWRKRRSHYRDGDGRAHGRNFGRRARKWWRS